MSSDTKTKAELLLEIDVISFAITEMVEYLDTHPYEKAAIDYVNYYIRKKNQLMTEFSYLYEPLTLSVNQSDGEKWQWALSQMPWEGEC